MKISTIYQSADGGYSAEGRLSYTFSSAYTTWNSGLVPCGYPIVGCYATRSLVYANCRSLRSLTQANLIEGSIVSCDIPLSACPNVGKILVSLPESSVNTRLIGIEAGYIIEGVKFRSSIQIRARLSEQPTVLVDPNHPYLIDLAELLVFPSQSAGLCS